jgi:glycosyltransferase involved in cell wall biosynthesis
MYPLYPGDSYGVFVRNFESSLQDSALEVVHKSVIKGKGKSLIQKANKYLAFYLSVLYIGLFKSYDFIYCHNVSHTVFPLIFIKFFRKNKLLLNAHGEDILPTTLFGRFLAYFSQFIIKKATLVVVPSHYFKEIVIRKFGLATEKIFVSASGGVDLKVFQPKLNKVREGDFVIGFVSRIEKNKGYHLFLEAIKEINDQYKDIHFSALMAGGGTQQAQVLNFLEFNNLQQKVNFIGPQAQKDLPEVLNKMDVLVFPTLFKESLGLIGLEAMACGVPVIGSRSGGLTDYIQSGMNGFFFEPGDIKDLVEKLIFFYSLPATVKEEMNVQALNTARHFGQEIVARKLVEHLTALL